MNPIDPPMGDDHDAPDHACNCSQSNADEMHELVVALAAHRGFDICDPGDTPDDDDAMDLTLIHEALVGQGAHCSGPFGDDEDEEDDMDDDGDESSEFELHHFSDDDEPADSGELAGFSDDETDTPAETDPTAAHDVATFDLDPPAAESAGDWVTYPNSLLFRSGRYEKKNFEMSPDELRRAAESFSSPVANELEHVNSQGIATILDGKLGHVAEVRASDDGTELRGTVVIPRWLDRVWGDGAKKVSCVWDRSNKSLRKLGLVIQGHVPDAALMAAFGEAELAAFATPRRKHEHTTHAHQLIHDAIRMGYPGVCAGGPMRPPGATGDDASTVGMSEADAAYFADHPQQLKSLRAIHSMTVENGAQCAGSGQAKMSATETRGAEMSQIDNAADEITDEEVTTFVHDHPDVVALKAELEALRAERAADKAKFAEQAEAARVKTVAEAAAAFADAEVKAGRSTSAQFDDLIDAYTEAAELDHKLAETVTFSDANGAKVTGSRVEKLKAREARRPAHSLFSPALGDGELVHDGEKVLFNTKVQDNGELTEEERRAYLSKTPAGIATLAARENTSKKGN